ncbi:MAG: hypothetical protein JW976_05225 [Syntrophaceae bacterium]|nr:hypothetical protein [Syntrophaceae bacterium]
MKKYLMILFVVLMLVGCAKTEPVLNADMKDWTVKDLLILKQNQLMELFAKLPCPTMREMQGEFRGDILDTGRFWFIKDICAHFALNSYFSRGKWLGKGFAKTTESEGYGYNSYLKFGKINHIYPMKTKIAKSVFDGKDEFELDYTVYKSTAGFVNMVDEVRKVNDNLYLGIGTWGYCKAQRRIPWFFALSGPRSNYAGVDKQHQESNRKFTR